MSARREQVEGRGGMRAVEVDVGTLGLSHNLRFIEVVSRSWASYKQDGGVSLEETRRRHGAERKVSRRRKTRLKVLER